MTNLIMVAALALAGSAAAQGNGTHTSLDDYAHRAMTTFATPGMAVVIVQRDIPTIHTYGVRRLGAPDVVDAHTIFPLGSNTKAFTSTALALLVDRDKLQWSDHVQDRLPGFRMYDPYTSAEMTVTDMLVHRSGLGLGEGDLLLFPSTNRTRADVVHALRYLKPKHSFRANYDYDNVLYVVAGSLLQAVSGEPWKDFVQHNILDPLNMRDTQTSIDARVPDQASLHGKISGPVRGLGPQSVLSTVLVGDVFAPAGALQSSASDMGKWLQMQLADGVMPDGKRFLSTQAMQAIRTPQTLIPINPQPPLLALAQPQFQAYALGLEISDYRGHKIITHTGAVLGALSAVVILPEKHVAFAIMINSEDGGVVLAMRNHLLDSLLGLSEPDWIASYKTVLDQHHARALKLLNASSKTHHADQGPSLPPTSYAGVYRDDWYGTVTIRKAGSGMTISFDRTPGMTGTLSHWQYDTFRATWNKPGFEDAYVTFALKPDGSIDRMTMKAVSPIADFSWDYQDLHFTPVSASK